MEWRPGHSSSVLVVYAVAKALRTRALSESPKPDGATPPDSQRFRLLRAVYSSSQENLVVHLAHVFQSGWAESDGRWTLWSQSSLIHSCKCSSTDIPVSHVSLTVAVASVTRVSRYCSGDSLSVGNSYEIPRVSTKYHEPNVPKLPCNCAPVRSVPCTCAF